MDPLCLIFWREGLYLVINKPSYIICCLGWTYELVSRLFTLPEGLCPREFDSRNLRLFFSLRRIFFVNGCTREKVFPEGVFPMGTRRKDRREAKERRYRQAKRPIDKITISFGAGDGDIGVNFGFDDFTEIGGFIWKATYPCTLTGIRWTGQVTPVRGAGIGLDPAPQHAFMLFFILKGGAQLGDYDWVEARDAPIFYSQAGFPDAERVVGWQSFCFPGLLSTPAAEDFYFQSVIPVVVDGITGEVLNTERYSKAQRKMMVGDELHWRGFLPSFDADSGSATDSSFELGWSGGVQIFIKS